MRSRNVAPPHKQATRAFRRISRWLVTVIATASLLRAFVMATYVVPSGSMLPTLAPGDLLFVNRLAYRSLSHMLAVRSEANDWVSRRRFDVVVFDREEAASGASRRETLVKRVVGLPGDTLFMRHGILFVNSLVVLDPESWSTNQRYRSVEAAPEFSWQHSASVIGSRFGTPPTIATHDDWGPIKVPDRSLFVLGDNRYDSRDSRYFGFVATRSVIGRVEAVLLSIDAQTDLSHTVRWTRIGRAVR